MGRLPVSSGSGTAAIDDLDWNQNDIDAAMAEAKETGKPVFVDFGAYTCTNCREMEANAFPAPVVAEHLRTDFVLLRLYTDDTDKGPALQRYQQKMVGTVALPSYAVVTPEKDLIVQHSGMASPEAFGSFSKRDCRRARPPRLRRPRAAPEHAPPTGRSAGLHTPSPGSPKWRRPNFLRCNLPPDRQSFRLCGPRRTSECMSA